MALRIGDRVKATTTTTGTGSYALTAIADGHQTFQSGVGAGDQCPYCCTDGVDWEIGIGTLSDSVTLARTVVLKSSNANAAVNWAAGSKDVFVTDIAAYLTRQHRWALFPSPEQNTLSGSSTLPTLSAGALASVGSDANATGDGSIAMGFQASAGSYGLAIGGINPVAGINAASVAGVSNAATGRSSGNLGGEGNLIAGNLAVGLGGSNYTHAMQGSHGAGAGIFDAGLSEVATFVLPMAGESTSATAIVLAFFDDETPRYFFTDLNAAYHFDVVVMARSTAGVMKSWRLVASVKSDGAYNPTITGSVTPEIIAEDAGSETWTAVVTANTVNDRIDITCTGAAATTITWGARAVITQLLYFAP